MACDTKLKPKQTLQERVTEARAAISGLDRLLGRKKVGVKVGPQGAIAFTGWSEADRNGLSDACAFRLLMVTGSALAKLEIAKAEQMAGRTVNRAVVGQGIHSHDGGNTWGKH